MSDQLTIEQKRSRIRSFFHQYKWTIISNTSNLEIENIYNLYENENLNVDTQNPTTWAYYGTYFLLTQKYTAALPWNKMAADAKNDDGLINMAYHYIHGHATKKDTSKAIDMLESLSSKQERAMAYLLVHFCDNATQVQKYIVKILTFSLNYINCLTTRLSFTENCKYLDICMSIQQQAIQTITNKQDINKHDYAVLFYNLAINFRQKNDVSNELICFLKSAELEQDSITMESIIWILQESKYHCLDFIKKYIAFAQKIELQDAKIEFLKLKPQGISVEQAEQDFLLHQQNLKSQT